jgi:hypothetical protein
MYKVVTKNNLSLGLRKNPNIMHFPVSNWVFEPNPLYGNMDNGGIWCTRSLSNARKLKKYYEERYGEALIYLCNIGNILYENSYRVKTDMIYLIKNI